MMAREQAHRHDQDHRERQRSRLSYCAASTQEHEQHADREHVRAPVLAAGGSAGRTDRSIRSEKPLGSVSSASFFMVASAVAELVPGSVSPCSSGRRIEIVAGDAVGALRRP